MLFSFAGFSWNLSDGWRQAVSGTGKKEHYKASQTKSYNEYVFVHIMGNRYVHT